MEWLYRLWEKLIRDVILVIVGAGIGISQIFANPPHWQLLLFAMGLISPATAAALLRISASQNGSTPSALPPPGPSSPPPPPPSPTSSGGDGG